MPTTGVQKRYGVTRTLRVLLAQLEPATHDVEANAATVCTLLGEHPDADLAVFPELFLQAYALRGITPVDLDAGGPVARVAEAARRARTAVVVGTPERGWPGPLGASAWREAGRGRPATRRPCYPAGAQVGQAAGTIPWTGPIITPAGAPSIVSSWEKFAP